MTEGKDILDWIGLSGIVTFLLGAMGYGSLRQRVKTLEDKDNSASNAVAIARLEEQMKGVRADIADIKKAVVK
jgi:hypothetical protein